MTSPLASILIVNYNGQRHLRTCLQALMDQTLPADQFEIIVVDNASQDGDYSWVTWEFPTVQWIPLAKNMGFAEGNNIARTHARGQTLVLLNNDTIPDAYWLEELLNVVAEHPGELVASKLVFAHDPCLLNSGGLVLLRDGRGTDAGFRWPDQGQFESTRPIFAGCGAALAIPHHKHQELFASSYFMYYEDTDLGWRHQLAGAKAVLAPRSVVRHVHGAAAGEASPLFRFYVERNRALTALRNADIPLAVWSGLILCAKVMQSASRVLRGRESPRLGFAVGRALASYVWNIPAAIVQRYHHRGVA